MVFNIESHLGATRFVVCIGKVAIKLPRPLPWRNFLQGFLANLQEREFSRLKHPYLAKVLYSDPMGFLLVMERADTDVSSLLAYSFLDRCRKQNLPVDPVPSNVGKVNGKLKLIDYGS